ncbi:cytochrome o ubiquinol oxidase subunit I, partial [Klebsiella pneumoniae]|nr:cytochrome o ubiquinol oxidase subunit I [Klebsiella pneumoniae]
IAHFHNTIIGGVVFGCIAGMTYWFPKAFGFKLNERLGRYSFYCWFVGFFLAFMPLYILGFKGMTRRLNHYDNPEWQPYLLVALAGAALIMLGIWFLLQQVFVSVRQRKQNQDITGDPWDGRTLEWSISSPAPFYNFAHVPHVDELDQFWEDKQSGKA